MYPSIMKVGETAHIIGAYCSVGTLHGLSYVARKSIPLLKYTVIFP